MGRIGALVARNEALDREVDDGVEARRADVHDRVLVEPEVEHGEACRGGEVVEGLLGIAERAVKIVALFEVANRLAERDSADDVPGDWSMLDGL